MLTFVLWLDEKESETCFGDCISIAFSKANLKKWWNFDLIFVREISLSVKKTFVEIRFSETKNDSTATLTCSHCCSNSGRWMMITVQCLSYFFLLSLWPHAWLQRMHDAIMIAHFRRVKCITDMLREKYSYKFCDFFKHAASVRG